MKIEAGKYYRTRDGRKVGPIVKRWTYDVYPWGTAETGCCYSDDGAKWKGGQGTEKDDLIAEWADEPTLWRDMTPEEKGALLLARHEWKMIQCSFDGGPWSDCEGGVLWLGGMSYRVKPEPAVETVTLFGGYVGEVWGFADFRMAADTHKLALTIIDGEVQPVATVEKL
jgi:hypothetical protein